MEIKRECGDCGLCCKLLEIPEFDAPKGKWCPKYDKNKGCTIYGNHPTQCKKFKCLWLLGVDSEKNRPDKSKVVMKFVRPKDNILQLQIYVDQGSPDAWKTEFMQQLIEHQTEKDGRTIVIYGKQRRAIGKRHILKGYIDKLND